MHLAEEEGFEPPEPFRAQRFSRPPHSTTLPLLRGRRCLWEGSAEGKPPGANSSLNQSLTSAAGLSFWFDGVATYLW